MKWYIKVLKNYANFQGRARRKEYWMFTLVNIFIGVIFAALMVSSGQKPGLESPIYTLLLIYQIAIIVPTVAVGVRRLHDTGYSGWWYLLILVPFLGPPALIIFFCLEGVSGENDYGPDPKNKTVKKL